MVLYISLFNSWNILRYKTIIGGKCKRLKEYVYYVGKLKIDTLMILPD